LVLFPSYAWHGVIPFETDDRRLTMAFDVVPSWRCTGIKKAAEPLECSSSPRPILSAP